jgi:peptidoglycan/xylan/chitin deacetylase (PgdA/CDA1 family)
MKTEGHEIANHTWNHPYGSAEVKSQLTRTDDAIRKAAGVTTKLMRPPGGVINSATKNCGKPIILWTADPKDWRDRNASLVYDRVVSQTKSGGIILLHDLYSSSTSAGLRAIDTLKKKGYAFVTVSEILGNPRAGVVYTPGSATPRTMKIA